MSRWMLGLAIALIVFGVGWFVVGLPQARPLVDGLWMLNDALLPIEASAFGAVSTFVHNLWIGAAALPLSLKLALIGLIILTLFALQRYAHNTGRTIAALLPPPLRLLLDFSAGLWQFVVFLFSQRLAATA